MVVVTGNPAPLDPGPRVTFRDMTPRCYACHWPVEPEEPHRRVYWDAPSGPGWDVFVHEDCLKAMEHDRHE